MKAGGTTTSVVSVNKESTIRSIIHLDKIIKQTQEKRSIERSYLKQHLDKNKGIDIVRSTYYQSRFPDTTGADNAVSREEYFKEHVDNKYLSIHEGS